MKIMASGPIISWQINGEKVETVSDFIFLESRINADSKCSHKIKRHLLLERIAMWNLDSVLKSRDTALPTKVHIIKLWVFQWLCTNVRDGPWRRLSAEELMLLNCGAGKDSWKSLDSKEIKPVNPKGNQPWIFIGRTDAEAKAPILWPPDVKSWLICKDPNTRKDRGQEEKGVTEDEMVG